MTQSVIPANAGIQLKQITNWIPACAGMTKIIPISRFTIQGNSMLPTLSPGQDVLSFNWAYLGQKPKVGDIVVIKRNGKEMIKRVQKVTRSVIPPKGGIQIKVFVTGDNKKESTDSRHFGMIKLSQIIGKVIYKSD